MPTSVPTYVDTHCHLDMHDDLTVAAQVARAREEGVGTLITVGTDMARSTQAVQAAARYDGVWAVVGVHPNDAIEATPRVLEVIDRLAAQDVAVGIGETGLDYYRQHTEPRLQDRAFRQHVALAHKHEKALVIHCRDAWEDTLKVLDDEGAPERVVLHCYSGDLDVTRRCVEAGYYLSFAGNVTFKNADHLRASAAEVPLDQLLTETDSPFLSPHPHRGKPNEPARVRYVVSTLAGIKGVPDEDLACVVAANARRAFALPDVV